MDLRLDRELAMIRKLTVDTVAVVTASEAERVLDGGANNLRWQVGHILWSSEWLVYGLADRPLPHAAGLAECFGQVTSAADFTADTPNWDDLRAALAASGEALRAHLAAADLAAPLAHAMVSEEHLIDVRTVGDAGYFAVGHEAYHIGQIALMRRLLG